MNGFDVFKGPDYWAKVIWSADVTPILESLANFNVWVSDLHNSSIDIYGNSSKGKIPVPEILRRHSSDGSEILARFFLAAGLVSLDDRQFAAAGYGNKKRYERWWMETFRPFNNVIQRTLTSEEHLAMANEGARALGHVKTDLPPTPTPVKAPRNEDATREKSSTVGAIALALGAHTGGPAPVILGTEGEHRALFGSGGAAYYINLDRLLGATKEERMVDALAQLARLGCREAREAYIQIDGGRQRSNSSISRGER